jgi:hypothetical protein
MINNFCSITIHGLLKTGSNRYFLFTSNGYAQNNPCQITLALDEHEIYHIYILIEQELDMHKLCKSSTLIYIIFSWGNDYFLKYFLFKNILK